MTPTEKIKQIQSDFGMSAKVASKAVGLSYGVFRGYLLSNSFQDYHVERLKEFLIEKVEQLKSN